MAIGKSRPRKRLSGLLGWLRSPVSTGLAAFIALLFSGSAAFATGGMAYQGVNISGGEFNQKWVPARYNWDYV